MVRMKENNHEAENFEKFWGSFADEITYTDYRNQDGLDKIDRYTKEREENKSYSCPALWQRMTVNVAGEVTACCRDAGKRLTLGIYDEKNPNLTKIWEGKNLKDFPLLSTTGCFARTPNDMEFLFNYIKGKNVKDKLSFDLKDINNKKLSDLKIGWCCLEIQFMN